MLYYKYHTRLFKIYTDQCRVQGLVWAHQDYGKVYTNDAFKQAIVADTGTHKVYNSTFLSLLLKLNTWQSVDTFALKIHLNSSCFLSVFL